MTNEQTKYECQNCEKAFLEDKLITPIPDLDQRVAPGRTDAGRRMPGVRRALP